MKKTVLLAATLLTLGVGSAFAGDGDVYAPPAQVTQSAAPRSGAPQSGAPQSSAPQSGAPESGTPQHLLFPTRTSRTTDIYPQFGYAGLDGGQG